LEGCEFPDARLKTRFGKLLGQFGKKIGSAFRQLARIGPRRKPFIASSAIHG
jgi:hypothetical protein